MLSILDYEVGMSTEIHRTFTANEVKIFSDLTGDKNPVHLDEKYAGETMFGSCIVHGALASSIFSTIFANTLPGAGCIYLKSESRFLKPIYLAEEVIFKVEITEIIKEKNRLIFKTVAITRGAECIVGTAEIFIP